MRNEIYSPPQTPGNSRSGSAERGAEKRLYCLLCATRLRGFLAAFSASLR